MSGYCKLIIMGRVAGDIKYGKSSNNKGYCTFTIAYDAGFGDNKEPVFVRVAAFGKQAEFINKYFAKGDGIHLDGFLKSNKWTNNEGVTTTSLEMISERACFTTPMKKREDDEEEPSGEEKRFETPKEIPF